MEEGALGVTGEMLRATYFDAIYSLYSFVHAERVIQVGSGLLALEDVSRCFDYFAALLTVTISTLTLPRLNLCTWPCFPK